MPRNQQTNTTPQTLVLGDEDAHWIVILAHGAGKGMHSPFMQEFAQGLCAGGMAAGGIRTLRFNFPYMSIVEQTGKTRPPDRRSVLLQTYRAIIQTLRDNGVEQRRIVIGGKSLGGRMASLIADETGVGGLICLGYPFHPPGAPDRLRTEHLATLKTPTLICQGERDPFGNLAQVPGYQLNEAIRIHWLADGDHGFRPRKSSGLSESDNQRQAIDAVIAFLRALRWPKPPADA